eukprot:CAMPEP_0113707998 /NCGR_PEP_ID=MMETSP0038_2-20120614/28725_1 /TAXON_ID=2898 /ORGANISM="Cryptomonas paramecium" /LENGTH=169 /DNA_ID=CAMNT_0000633631 /DNA_START=1 /DNA_END=507 /DNA_ORIENTATION=+ /assembly_acc=CAM_ASM_000170
MQILFILALFVGSVSGGSFMAGSIRWHRVGALQARFDIVTYWTRSFSLYNQPNVSQQIILTAQRSVQFDPGDGTKIFLSANVTQVSEDEDWFEATTTVYHTYSDPSRNNTVVPDYDGNSSSGVQAVRDQRLPWIASLTGCCRYSRDLPSSCPAAAAALPSGSCGWARAL